MIKYTLYDYFRSSACYRVRIALALKNIEYTKKEVHLINNRGEQHSAEYKQINPQQLVPTLIDNETNQTYTQTLSIIEYLDEKHAKLPLLPKDIDLKAKVRCIANIIACDVHPLSNQRILQYLEKNLVLDKDEKALWYQHWMQLGFDSVEELLTKWDISGDYCCGDTPSIADCFLIPQVYNAKRFRCDLSNYPLINKINDNCLKLEAFITSAPE